MPDLDDLLGDLNESLRLYPAQKDKLLNKLGKQAVKKVKKYTPVRTGDLKASIQSRTVGNKVEVYSPLDYAESVDKGHVAGSTFVPGQNMFEKGLTEADNEAESIIDDFWDELKL